MAKTYLIYCAAALAEIAGCFGFWLCWRGERATWLLPLSLLALALFAWLLTLVESPAAGRTFAAYGGIYIIASLAWLWGVEGLRPDRWDVLGAGLCLLGASLIVFAPRAA